MKVSVESNLHNKARIIIFALFVFLMANISNASNEKIKGVEMMNCHADFCVQLNTLQIYKSALTSSYAFGPAHLKVFRQNKPTKDEFVGFEGTFDPQAKRFYLSKEDSAFDYVIDAIDKKIYRFPKS